MTLTLYGIPNCDTVKKARAWLDANGQTYIFHDYKKLGIDRATLDQWCATVGWEKLLNKAGTTFKKLAEIDKVDLDQAKAVRLMLAQPSMIKRPVVVGAKSLLIGFKAEEWAALLALS